MGERTDGTDDADVASEDPFPLLWRRIKDHRIAQWTVGYVAVAYGIQHAVTLTAEAFEWPHAVTRLSMLLLVLGLPLAMVFAWYHGERTTRRVSAGEMTLASLLLVLISLVFFVFLRPSEPIASRPAVQEAGVTAARQASLSPGTAISLAVMPFENLSPDPNQGFFSDGMTQEITSALTKIAELRVVARESAFAFKGKNTDVRNVGKALGATHLLEGSVRKAGDQLRISAELVRADNGVAIWSNSYDRELKDVFAVQEDIARSIAASLHMTLGLKPGENLISNRKIDTTSYANYLRALAITRSRGALGTTGDTLSLLQDVVAKNPDYAPGWALLGQTYYFQGIGDAAGGSIAEGSARAEAVRQRGEAAVRRALELDPNNTEAYTAAGALAWTRGKMLEADALYAKAMAIDPLDVGALDGYAVRLAAAGHNGEALKLLETAHSIDPFSPVPSLPLVQQTWVSGKDDDAIALAKSLRPQLAAPLLAMIYSSQGHRVEAADILEQLKDNPRALQAAKLLRSESTKASPAESLPRFPAQLEFVYLYTNFPERALDVYQRRADANYFAGNETGSVWHKSYAPMRKTARFKQLMIKGGMLEYWRAKGWPPQCHPTTGDDFECN